MSAGEIAYWLADHVTIWRPFALAGLGLLVLVIVYYAVTAWESTK